MANLAAAYGLSPDRDRRAAIMATLRLCARSLPHLAARYDPPDPDEAVETVEAWEISVEQFCAATILEAGRRLVRRMASETKDFAPTAPRLAAYCREVAGEVGKAAPMPLIEETDEAAEKRLMDHAARLRQILTTAAAKAGKKANGERVEA